MDRRRCRRLREARDALIARRRAAAVRIQTRVRIMLARREAGRRRRRRWAWFVVVRACMLFRWQCIRRKRARCAVQMQRVVRGFLARRRAAREAAEEEARMAQLAADSLSLSLCGGHSFGIDDGGDTDADAVEVISMADPRLLSALVGLGPGGAVQWFLRRAVLAHSPEGGYALGSFLQQVMRYAGDAFARSVQEAAAQSQSQEREREREQQEQAEAPQRSAEASAVLGGEAEGGLAPAKPAATPQRVRSRADKKAGRSRSPLSPTKVAASATGPHVADGKAPPLAVGGEVAYSPGPWDGAAGAKTGDGAEQVVRVERWDAFQAAAPGDGAGDAHGPGPGALPADWGQAVCARRRAPPPAEGAAEGPAPVSPLSTSEDTRGTSWSWRPGDGNGAADVDDAEAEVEVEAEVVSPGGRRRVPWVEVGARVSVFYMRPAGAGLFSESFDQSFDAVAADTDPGGDGGVAVAAGGPAAVSEGDVGTFVLQIDLPLPPLPPVPALDGEAAGGVQGADADALTADSNVLVPVPGAAVAAKKSKVLFILHALPPPLDEAPPAPLTADEMEVPARTLFRDMLIRMLGSPAPGAPGALAMTPLRPPKPGASLAAASLLSLSQQSLYSAVSLDDLVAGGDGWGAHPRHLYALRMTLVDDPPGPADGDEEDEDDAYDWRKQAGLAPAKKPGRDRPRDPPQSVHVTPLGLAPRAAGGGVGVGLTAHALAQPHSQLRLMLVSPPKPKRPPPPDWHALARRLQRPARRHLARRRAAAARLRRAYHRRHLLRRWRHAVAAVTARAAAAALRIQRAARGFLAARRVRARRLARCEALEGSVQAAALVRLLAAGRWDDPAFVFGDVDASGGGLAGGDAWMLCPDDVALFVPGGARHPQEAPPADTMSAADFRRCRGDERVAATHWAAALLAQPQAAPPPPGCLLPYTLK